MATSWAIYRREPDGSETYLAAVDANHKTEAIAKADGLRFIGEDPAVLRVRPVLGRKPLGPSRTLPPW